MPMPVTIHNLEESTSQEVFDTIAAHLLTQNAQSIIEESNAAGDDLNCVYHAPDGKKCAAGCLIPDADYISEIEGFVWRSVIIELDLSLEHAEIIRELQWVHDRTSPEYWPKRLHIIAKSYGILPYPRSQQ